MTELRAARVHEIAEDCLFREGEDRSAAVLTEGVVRRFGWHPQRLLKHRAEIEALLLELPDDFRMSKGGGWSFLNACMNQHGQQWGEQADVEVLMCLGLGIGRVMQPLPREMWSALPGGMPYFAVVDTELKDEEKAE